MSDSPNDPGYLAPAEFVDSDHPAIISFARETAGSTGTDLERVLRLFHAIRDGIRYDPYMPMSEKQSFRASDCLMIGVPARCGYADVRNHLATRKLLESMGTDVFFWHSFSDLYLEGKWVKATPAFNRSLCDKFGLKPLEFDGRSDSLFHEFDRAGNKHMEYIRFRGTYADVPYAEIIATFVEEYGEEDEGLDGDFEAEAGHD